MALPPLIRWPGGQSRDAAKIVRHLPDHDTYVEPFAGGLSVMFAKEPAKHEVAGDADPWLIDFYAKVRNGGLRKCRGGFRIHRPLFERAKTKNDACHKMALATISYDGNRSTYGPSGREGQIGGRSKLAKLPEYEKRLRRTHLVNDDFAAVMRRFDSPRTLHFLDPPWNIEYAERWYYGGSQRSGSDHLPQGESRAFDPVYVRNVAEAMKGAVAVIYKQHPAVTRAFKGRKGWTCRTISSTRGAQQHGTRPIMKTLCIKKPGAIGKMPRSSSSISRSRSTSSDDVVRFKVVE